MITYYIKKDNKIELWDTDKQRLVNTLLFKPDLQGLDILETEDIIVDGEIITQEEYDKRQAEKERERLDNLNVTRGDMFEALLLAKQITKAQVRELIIQYVTDEVQQALMLNRFDEALNFYRGYPIFNLLGAVIGITPVQWDKYFEKATNEETKAEAYKYLTTCKVTVETTPADALINGEETKEFTVNYGDGLELEVTCDGYIPQTITLEEVTEDKTIEVTLEEEQVEENSEVENSSEQA